jgi:formate dehydrogenase iron-sulfur subunit
VNELPREPASDELSGYSWTAIDRTHGMPVKRQCMHCEDPACVSVCPVAALQKSPEGPVIYASERCMGCRYCLLACPFSIPRYQWDRSVPYVQKCIMCYDKLVSKGEQPACTSVCPAGATIFGDRKELVEEARKRIRENPERYVDHIFGLTEAGGTSVLYLSPVPFSKLGFKEDVQHDSYPDRTWAIMEKLPGVVGVMGAVMTGIWWITHRREQVEREEREERERSEVDSSEDVQ